MKKILTTLFILIPLIAQASATYHFNFTSYSKKYNIRIAPQRISCIDSITYRGTIYDNGSAWNLLGTPVTDVQVVDKNPWLTQCYGSDKIANFKILDANQNGNFGGMRVIQSLDFKHTEETHGSTDWVTLISPSPDGSFPKDLLILAMCKKHGVDAQYYQDCFGSNNSQAFWSDDDQDIDIYFRDPF